MPTPSYTLEQAEEDIANLKGTVALLNEILQLTDQGQVPNTPAANTFALFSQLGQPQYVNDDGLQMGLVGAQQAWQPGNTVSGASLGNLASWTIPAGDANVDALYRTEVWGTGETGTSNATIQFAVVLGGTTMATTTTAAVFFNTASFSFTWHYTAVLLCVSLGTGGTWMSAIYGEISALALVDPGSGNQNTAGSCGCDSTTTTKDTTVAETFGISAKWGAAATGSQGLTSQIAIAQRWC